MNKAMKKKWVEALLSGDYKQGKTHLKKDNKYCCLGVLDEICNLGILDGAEAYMTTNTAFLKAGLTYNSYFPDTDELGVYELTRMNDSGEWDFGDIAGFIDAEF